MVEGLTENVKAAEEAKEAAAAAYEDAKNYMDNESQQNSLSKATNAYMKAKEYLQKLLGDRDDALDMQNKASMAIEEAGAALEKAELISFDNIIAGIQGLIDEHDGGDGTVLEKFLEGFVVPEGKFPAKKKCASTSIHYEKVPFEDGSVAHAWATDCTNTSKYFTITVQGPANVAWSPDMIVEMSPGLEETRCMTNKKKKWQKCWFEMDLGDYKNAAIHMEHAGWTKIVARQKTRK